MTTEDLQVTVELTPNPDSLRYAVNREILPAGTEYLRSREEAEEVSPLATALFDLGGIGAVLIGRNFVNITLTSREGVRELHQKVQNTIREVLTSDQPACKVREHQRSADEDQAVARIREVIDTDIRPALARDGGDIVFEDYRDGVVFLQLQGACKGCPGAAMTLKMGVEARLREVVPEVREVLAVN